MRISDRRSGRILVTLALGLAACAASALPPALQADRLPAADRARLEARAAMLAGMSPEARAAFAARVAAWHALPAAERARRRTAHEAAEALPHAERMQLQQTATQFAALPEAEQLELRTAFEQLDQGLRRGWLLGPVLGADWPGLHALFSALPGSERAPALLALRAMSPQARLDLAALAQRTPPHEREALRRDWLAVPADARDAWLRSRVTGAP
ncbi:MAG: DUF3106 domain-containing protein [Luteimonas sp.]